ncbi:hypothetical protein ACLOJK_015763 [Asimina triloba]
MPGDRDPTVFEEEEEDDDSEDEDEDEDEEAAAARFEARQSRRIEDEEDDVDDDDEDEEEDLNSPSPSSSSSDEKPKNPNPPPAPNPHPKNPAAVTPAAMLPTPAAAAPAAAPPNGSAPNPSPPVTAAAVLGAAEAAVADVDEDSSPERKRVCTEEKKMMAANPLDDSRRLFQRLWTDEDEIELLQGFLEFIQQRGGGGGAYHHDTGPFYDQIKSRLQLDFNKSQLVEKLRRLKKKYRNIMNKLGTGKEFAFKRAHDQATFEISRKIWSNDTGAASVAIGDDEDGNGIVNNLVGVGVDLDKKGVRSRRRSRKRSVPEVVMGISEDHMPTYAPPPLSTVAPVAAPPPAPAPAPAAPSPLPNAIEDTVRSCLSPLFKELLNCAINGPCNSALGGVSLSPLPLNFSSGSLNIAKSEVVDDRWRKQQIMELEVYSKRLELVQEQIKLALEDLKSGRR